MQPNPRHAGAYAKLPAWTYFSSAGVLWALVVAVGSSPFVLALSVLAGACCGRGVLLWPSEPPEECEESDAESQVHRSDIAENEKALESEDERDPVPLEPQIPEVAHAAPETNPIAAPLRELIAFHREVVAAARESVERAQEIVSEAIEGLSEAFGRLRTDSTSQNESSIALVDRLETIRYRPDADGELVAPPFIQSTTELLEDFIRQILSVSKGSIEIAHRINEAMDDISRIRATCERANHIANQTSLLALNAKIKARAAGEHGKVFTVVADEMRVLAGEAGDFNIQIQDSLTELCQGFDRIIESVRALAERDLSETIFAKGQLDSTFDEIRDVNFHLESSLQEFTKASTRLDADVADATRALQFEDIVRQLHEHATKALDTLTDEEHHPSETLAEADPVDAVLAELEARRASFESRASRPVRSRDLDEGEVELF